MFQQFASSFQTILSDELRKGDPLASLKVEQNAARFMPTSAAMLSKKILRKYLPQKSRKKDKQMLQ